MSEWWTYTLSDIVMFSRHTYYRLFELYNAAIWPAQVVFVGAGISIGMLLRRSDARRGRLITALLAACWLWVAIAFHANRYATIHWAAVYFAVGFGLEAALLVWNGVIRRRMTFSAGADATGRAGLWIFVFALGVQPFIGPLLGRSWRQVEIFGVAPDPTAIGTLGMLLLASGRVRWELAVLPVVWCAISGATLLAMRAPDAWSAPVAALLVLSLAIGKTSARRLSAKTSTGERGA